VWPPSLVSFHAVGTPTSSSPPSVVRRRAGACSVSSCPALPHLRPLQRQRALAGPRLRAPLLPWRCQPPLAFPKRLFFSIILEVLDYI
jgi:hypothetical protein